MDFGFEIIFPLIITMPPREAPPPTPPPPPRLPTTREIAEASGFHQSTVSYALRGNAKIPPKTRDRILQIAHELGWRPNALASAYMSQLRMQRPPSFQASLGFLNTHLTSNRPNDWLRHQWRNFHGARARAAELGYTVESFWLHEPGLNPLRFQSILDNRNIIGVIVPERYGASKTLEKLDWVRYTPVALEFSLEAPWMDRVCAHNTQGFQLALRQIGELGYRRIGVLASHQYDRVLDNAILCAVAYAKLFWHRDLEIIYLEFEEPGPAAVPAIQSWLQREKPEIVLGEVFVMQAITGMGWSIPKDIAFASLDTGPDFPEIAGYDHRHDEQGRAAVDMVVGRLLRNERGPPPTARCLMIDGAWQNGASAPGRRSA